MRLFAILAFLFFASAAPADLIIWFVNESDLPDEFAPGDYANSPSNYDNSINKFENSPSNEQNSESNFANSPSSDYNGPKGDNRLLLEGDRKPHRVGYYVRAESGVLNFFSPKGKRLFYNPGKGVGIFHGKRVFFCGVLARLDGKLQLVLTEKGQEILLLAIQRVDSKFGALGRH